MGSILPTLSVWLVGFLGAVGTEGCLSCGARGRHGSSPPRAARERLVWLLRSTEAKQRWFSWRSDLLLYLFQQHHQDLHV